MLQAHKADRDAISLDLARADAYVCGDDRGATKIEGLPRVTLKGLRHTHATLLLELGAHPKVVVKNASDTPRSRRP